MMYLAFFAAVAVLAMPLMFPASWLRIGSVYGMIVLAYLAITSLLGEPKPARIELLASLDRSEVLWARGSATEGIYIVTPGPKLYSLPWSEQTMRELHEAMRAAAEGGGTVELREPGQGTPGGDWSVVHVPPPEPAPKS